MEKDQTQTETVLTADSFFGPYTIVREKLRPLGMSAGDFDLAVAPDGKRIISLNAYILRRSSPI